MNIQDIIDTQNTVTQAISAMSKLTESSLISEEYRLGISDAQIILRVIQSDLMAKKKKLRDKMANSKESASIVVDYLDGGHKEIVVPGAVERITFKDTTGTSQSYRVGFKEAEE